MLNNSTRTSWLFPPPTREVQFDEQWAFVGKKEKHDDPNDPDDDNQGDHWDALAFDPEHRLVVSLVTGKRPSDHAHRFVEACHQRTAGQLRNRMTSDENPAYAEAIREVYGQEVQRQRRGKRGRKPKPVKVLPKELT
jgi:IS1 family transposase